MILTAEQRRFDVVWLGQAFSSELILIYPVYAVMMQGSGINPLELSLLFVIWSVAALVFEVPSGVVGDLVARKHVIVAGGGIKAAAFAVWFAAPTFTGFALGFTLWSLGSAARSGTLQALLHDSLADQGRLQDFARVYGRGRAAQGAGVVIALLCGGYAAEQDYALPLALSVLAPLISAWLVWRFVVEPPRGAAETVTEGDTPGFSSTLAAGIREIRGNLKLLLVVAMFALLAGSPGMLEEYLGPRLDAAPDFSLSAIGVWYAVVWCAHTLGVAVAYRFRGWSLQRLALWYVLASLLLVVSQAVPVGLMPLLFAGFFLLCGVAEVMLETSLQRHIRSHARATVTSIAGMAMEAWGVCLYLLIGLCAIGYGWRAAFVLVGMISALVAVAFVALTARIARADAAGSTHRTSQPPVDGV